MDVTYRQDLRELNELNFARFDAKLEQRFAESDARLEKRFAEFEVKIERRLSEFEAIMTQRFVELQTRLEERITAQTRWMFGVTLTLILAVLSLWFKR